MSTATVPELTSLLDQLARVSTGSHDLVVAQAIETARALLAVHEQRASA